MSRQCVTDFNALVRGLIKAGVDLKTVKVQIVGEDSIYARKRRAPLRGDGDGLPYKSVFMSTFGTWKVHRGQYSPKVSGIAMSLDGPTIYVDHRQFVEDDQRLDHLY